MQKCWKDEAEKRPTFAEIVSQYHDGLIPGTTKTEQGSGYVLLGPEEKLHVEHAHEQKIVTSLNETSIMDISVINKDSKLSTPSVGTKFDVLFLSPSGVTGSEQSESDKSSAMPDQECYMEMNRVSNWHAGVSVLVNQAALHEYDDVARDHQEEVGAKREQDCHVTINSDHMTAGLTHSLSSTHSNGSQKLHTSTSDYILMRAANDIQHDCS